MEEKNEKILIRHKYDTLTEEQKLKIKNNQNQKKKSMMFYKKPESFKEEENKIDIKKKKVKKN